MMNMTLASGFNWWLPLDLSTHGHEGDELIVLLHYFSLLHARPQSIGGIAVNAGKPS